ncbi:MAG: CDGSH iron-sulfur domain-containing protein [Bacteroidales bacterium]
MDDQKKIAARLHLTNQGPIKVTGKFYIVDTQGNDLLPDSRDEVYLCTCGESRSKPFCDSSHKK